MLSYREINFKLYCANLLCYECQNVFFLFFKIARNLNHSLKRCCSVSTINYTTFLHIASNLFYIYLHSNFFLFLIV